MKPVCFAFIGCGRIAQQYLQIFQNNELPEAKLLAVCDKNVEQAKKFTESFSVPVYDDMHQMMQKHPELDAVLVLTETGGHAPITLALAPYKKHIVVEKPIALTLEDADKMLTACNKENIKLFVVTQNRYNLPVQELKKVCSENRLGKLFMGTSRVRWCRTQEYYDQNPWRGSWKVDGGVLVNQAIHHIDLLNWFLGEPVSVFAKSMHALAKIEAEDTGIAIIQYKNGALGTLEATTAARPFNVEASLSLLGSNGMIEIGGFAVNKVLHWHFKDADTDETEQISKQLSENPPSVYGFGHVRYLQNVIRTIQHDLPVSEGVEARNALELASAMYESIETGNEISLRFVPKFCKLGKAITNKIA